MKRFITLSVGLLFASLACADDRTRDVQTELKGQGFYFGEIDGHSNADFTAALRRYQIRNGLEVTGELSPDTLNSLGIRGAKGVGAAPEKTPQASAQRVPAARLDRTAPQPPIHLRREETVQETDRRALREEEPVQSRPPSDPSVLRPPAPLGNPTGPSRPSAAYGTLFEDTPYATAPRIVQEQTLQRAQRLLANRNHYAGAIDGAPGPGTVDAVLDYQRSNRLPPTGKLDLETLNALRLLPGRGSNPPLKPFTRSPNPTRRQQQPVRGIWVE